MLCSVLCCVPQVAVMGVSPEELRSNLLASCQRLDELGAGRASSMVQKETVDQINKRLRQWRKALGEGAGKGSKGKNKLDGD